MAITDSPSLQVTASTTVKRRRGVESWWPSSLPVPSDNTYRYLRQTSTGFTPPGGKHRDLSPRWRVRDKSKKTLEPEDLMHITRVVRHGTSSPTFQGPDNQSKMKRSVENAEHVGLFTPTAGLLTINNTLMPSSTWILAGILSKQNGRIHDMASMFITNMRERAKMAGNEEAIMSQLIFLDEWERSLKDFNDTFTTYMCKILTTQDQSLVKQDWQLVQHDAGKLPSLLRHYTIPEKCFLCIVCSTLLGGDCDNVLTTRGTITPVSLHPAVYYTHLASNRARAHENIATSDGFRTGAKGHEIERQFLTKTVGRTLCSDTVQAST
ncbi:hypothetical protein ACHAPO_000084 [Fusarium lateritium]